MRSAVWLSGVARDAVHHLKYGGWFRVADAMAGPVARLAPVASGGVLVPLPLGAARERERGYTQSDHLARAVARRRGGVVRRDLLRRPRETARQTGLAPDARRANVAGAFRAAPCRLDRVVLVDDVFTTGATLAAAAATLLGAGVRQVAAVTFARARRPLDDDVQALLTHDQTLHQDSP